MAGSRGCQVCEGQLKWWAIVWDIVVPAECKQGQGPIERSHHIDFGVD